ncbi:AAA family ATPase [Methylobacter sp.]|uniref:ExeA family protein n=1 Tax=Methylobacter sp. TaxID=2051955 RepID=UPI002487DA39|nr:AAA family ATPase [Methylobacter sp.]MDI1278055.1 AAA family ATPase [Methylobacter sp.]
MLALKPVLQSAGISQADLARAVELSPATIAQLLNKEIWPTTPDKTALQARISLVLSANGIEFNPQLFEPVSTASTADTEITMTSEVLDMLLRKQTLSPAAKKHFGLFRDPFSDDVNEADDVFNSPTTRYVREYLWSTAKFGGFMAVIGESGAGKSTLRKDLEERIAREQAPIILVQPYVLGMEDNDKKGKTLKSAAIMDAIILTLAPNERPKLSMEAKSRQLHRILKDSRRAGYAHCLIIEEAHALNTQTLKHLKRFLELEDGFKKLLSIILIGQTELKKKLDERSPEVREVVQRCELVELAPLDASIDDYLRFKFSRVGADIANVFEADAIDGIRSQLIFTKSSTAKNRETISLMYPLMVNNLVTAALNQAAQLGFAKVSGDLIREV